MKNTFSYLDGFIKNLLVPVLTISISSILTLVAISNIISTKTSVTSVSLPPDEILWDLLNLSAVGIEHLKCLSQKFVNLQC